MLAVCHTQKCVSQELVIHIPKQHQSQHAGASVDSWDRMREGAIACLLRLPIPLPGLGSPEGLLPQLQWAARLLRSPRVRESDAGGLQHLPLQQCSCVSCSASLYLVDGADHLPALCRGHLV